MTENREYHLKKYLILAFVIAWIFQIAGSVCAIKGGQMEFQLLVSICMFGPLVAVWITCGGLKKEKTGICWKPQFKRKWKWWFASWLLPILLSILGSLLYYGIFQDAFDATMSEYFIASVGKDNYDITYANMPSALLLVTAVVQIFFGAFVNMFMALGEEAGWRGYLYPALRQKWGVTKSRLFGGLIWGCWHWPIMILTGYEYGWSVFSSPIFLVIAGMFLFCLITVAYGTILDWLYEKSECIWAPALAHGALNAAAGFGLYMIKTDYLNRLYLGPAPIGLIGGLPFLIMAGGILILCKNREN